VLGGDVDSIRDSALATTRQLVLQGLLLPEGFEPPADRDGSPRPAGEPAES
jgi:hypothetical protein